MANQLNAIDRSSAMIEFDTNGHILNANNLFLQIMGYTLEQIKGKHHRMFVSENERESQAYQQFWQHLQQGTFIEKEFKRFSQDGQQIWLKATYNPIVNVQGKVYKIIKFASDITRQKKLDLDLQNQLHAINKSNAVVEFDLNDHIQKTNDLFLNLMGYTKEELADKHHQIFVEPEQAKSKEYELFWHQLRNGQHLEGEFPRYHKNGKTIWIKGSYNPILNDEGKVYKIVKYALDITERKMLEMENAQQLEEVKAAEEELRQNMEELMSTQEELEKQMVKSNTSNQLMNAILNTAVDAIITIDAKGIVKSVNPAITQLFGYKPDEVVGRNIKMLMPNQYASAHDHYLQNYHETGQKKIIGIGRQVEALHKDGTVFDAYISVSEVKLKGQHLFKGFTRKPSDLTATQNELQTQVESLQATEEELRQNMEELTSTQEELEKQFKVSEANNKVMDAVLNTALDVIVTMNDRGIIQSVNPVIETLFGYKPVEIIGQNVKILMPQNYAQAHDGYLQHYKETGHKKVIGIGRKVEAQHKDGTVFNAHLSVSKVKLEQKQLFTGFIRKLD